MKRLALFLLAIIFLLLSCHFYEGRTVQAILPEHPAGWQDFAAGRDWIVEYYSNGNVIMAVWPCDTDVISLKIDFSPYTVITARPAGDFRPAGICSEAAENMYRLTWEQGAAAQFFLDLPDLGSRMYDCNLALISEKFIEKSCGSPWTINRNYLKRHLIQGTMNGNRFRKSDSWMLEYDIEEEYISWDPFYPDSEDGFFCCLYGKNVFYSGSDKIIINAEINRWDLAVFSEDGTIDVSFGNW